MADEPRLLRTLDRDDAPVFRCLACGRTSVAAVVGSFCNMPQPDATRCRGRFIVRDDGVAKK